jgi:tRNA (cytosine34-C5)-methyltransferase
MCAAPGSKTAQLLESVLRSTPANTLPTGSVIANDLDNKRCYMLVHQTNRLASPALMVTNHEATGYPTLTLPNNGGDRLFDRVLCDVPCSGDGTLRKNVDLWKRWAPTLGLGIHSLQTTIAKRGIQMLAEGGNIVYSTCSLNPVEDEAVVAELLRYGKGALELVDVSDKLPGLKRCNGLSSWKILDKDGKWYERHSDLDDFRQRRIPKSCFPPTAEEAATLGLNKW